MHTMLVRLRRQKQHKSRQLGLNPQLNFSPKRKKKNFIGGCWHRGYSPDPSVFVLVCRPPNPWQQGIKFLVRWKGQFFYKEIQISLPWYDLVLTFSSL